MCEKTLRRLAANAVTANPYLSEGVDATAPHASLQCVRSTHRMQRRHSCFS